MKKISLVLSCLFLLILFGCGGEKTITLKEYNELKNPEEFTGTIKEMDGDTLILEGTFSKGKKNGKFTELLDGMIKVDHYNNDVLNGESTITKEGESEPFSRTTYLNGEPHGRSVSELNILNYENGQLHGVQIRKSYPFPNSIEESFYDHGYLIKSKTIFDINDPEAFSLNIEYDFNIDHDGRKPMYEESTYYESGNKEETIFFDKNDIKIFKENYPDIQFSNPKTTTYDIDGNVLGAE